MKKKGRSLIVIYCIIAVTFTLIFVLVPFDKQAVSWIAYTFAMVSLLGGLIIDWVAFRKAEALKSKFYGVSLFRLGIIYVCVQIAVSIIFIVVGAFVEVPFWASLAASILLIAITAIGTIVGDNLRDMVEQIEEKGINSTKAFTALQNKFAEIYDKCSDADLKEKMTELVEKFKYGDPVSFHATKEVEESISEQLGVLDSLISTGEKDQACESINTLLNLLLSRSRLCKTAK